MVLGMRQPANSWERLRDDIRHDLNINGSNSQYILVDVSGSANCWEQFASVCYRVDNERVVDCGRRFVACKRCHAVYTYTSTNGTSTLNKHDCERSRATPPKNAKLQSGHQPSIGANIEKVRKRRPGRPPKSSSNIISQKQQAAAKPAVIMCCQDLRAFRSVCGDGFRNLTQTVLDIGHHLANNYDVKDLLPDTSMLRRYVIDSAKAIRVILFDLLQEQIEDRMSLGFTIDVWTDPAKENSFMSITVHFIDGQFKHQTRLIQVRALTTGNRSFSVALKTFQDCLADFGITDVGACTLCCKQIPGKLDIDSLSSVLSCNYCAGDTLSSCLTPIFTKRIPTGMRTTSKPVYIFQNKAPKIFQLITLCKELVTFFKQSGLQSQLDVPLKQEYGHGWQSLLRLLNSVQDSYDQVSRLLAHKSQQHLVAAIDRDLLGELTRFLGRFKTAANTLGNFMEPTLHLIIYERSALLEHCQVQTELSDNIEDENALGAQADSSEIVAIKKAIAYNIHKEWKISNYQVMAALLDPRQKNRLEAFGISAIQIAAVKESLKTVMHSVGAGTMYELHEHAMKRRKVPRIASIDSSDDEDEDGENGTANGQQQSTLSARIDQELVDYWKLKLSRAEKDQLCTNTGLLVWWKANGTKAPSKKSTPPRFPILGRVVRSVLSVPAVSSINEKGIAKQRSQLSSSLVNDVLVVRSNKDLVDRIL